MTLSIFFLLIATAAFGLITGWWWHLRVARKHENELKLRLKVRNRQLRRLEAGFEITEEDLSLEGRSSNSKIRTAAFYQDENERLNSEISRLQSACDKLHVELTNADQGLEQKRENLANVRSELEYWQESFEELHTQKSQWEATKLTMDQQMTGYEQQQADLQLAVNVRDQALTDKQALLDRLEENEVQLAQLKEAQEVSTAAQQENERLNLLYADLSNKHKVANDEKHQTDSELSALAAQVDKLEEDLVTSKEATQTLRSEKFESRSVANKLKIDLAKVQRSFRDSQRQSEIFKAERDALSLRHANVDEILNASIIVAVPEPHITESNNSESVSKPPAQTGTASKSAPRRIKALETIVHNQRAKIEVLRNVVEDMQTVLQLDLPQSISTRQEVGALAANDSTKVDKMGLIKGIR